MAATVEAVVRPVGVTRVWGVFRRPASPRAREYVTISSLWVSTWPSMAWSRSRLVVSGPRVSSVPPTMRPGIEACRISPHRVLGSVPRKTQNMRIAARTRPKTYFESSRIDIALRI